MHRRQFLAAATSLLLPSASARAFQVEATPDATPTHHGRPRPIVLGDGIELIDYRIYPSPDVPRVIGEISSTRDDMVDAPVVSISFPDLGEDGFAWASPLLPVMGPGEANMIFGVLPDSIDTNSKLQAAAFTLCTPAEPGSLTELHRDLRLKVEGVKEERRKRAFHIEAAILNEGVQPVIRTKVRGMVRDSNDRIAGALREVDLSKLWPNQSKPFGFWESERDDIPANPFRLLDDDDRFTIELHPGTIGTMVAAYCG